MGGAGDGTLGRRLLRASAGPGGGAQTQYLLFLETPVRKMRDQEQPRGRGIVRCKTGRQYNTVYLSTFSRLLMDNIYSREKVETKTPMDFCETFLSMDPVPLNQNNAFCEG